MRKDFYDGIGILRLLGATLVLPKFKVALFWVETNGFADVNDLDYFTQLTSFPNINNSEKHNLVITHIFHKKFHSRSV